MLRVSAQSALLHWESGEMMTRTAACRVALVLFVFAICVQSAAGWENGVPATDGKVRTPETRTLTAEEATRVLQQDWLFQAMGEPLLDRAGKEIGWARQLADRLTRGQPRPDLSAELKELGSLEQRLVKLRDEAATAPKVARDAAVPSWIWYPEGAPAADAPAEARFFRRRLSLPSAVRGANVRVGAANQCEG